MEKLGQIIIVVEGNLRWENAKNETISTLWQESNLRPAIPVQRSNQLSSRETVVELYNQKLMYIKY